MNTHTVTLTTQEFADVQRALMYAERYARGVDLPDEADRYDALWNRLASGMAHTG